MLMKTVDLRNKVCKVSQTTMCAYMDTTLQRSPKGFIQEYLTLLYLWRSGPTPYCLLTVAIGDGTFYSGFAYFLL